MHGTGAGGVGGRGQFAHFGGDGGGGLGDLRDVATHLVGDGGLLLDRCGDGLGDLEDLAGDGGDGADAVDTFAGVLLNGSDALADLVGSLGGAFGEFLDFVRDDGEPFARFAGARCLDGGVEGEQVGLLGDGGDELDDFADVGRGLAQMGNGLGGGVAGLNGRFNDGGCFAGALSDRAHGFQHLVCATGDGSEAGGDFLAGFDGGAGHAAGLGCAVGKFLGDGGEFFRGRCNDEGMLADPPDLLREPGTDVVKGCGDALVVAVILTLDASGEIHAGEGGEDLLDLVDGREPGVEHGVEAFEDAAVDSAELLRAGTDMQVAAGRCRGHFCDLGVAAVDDVDELVAGVHGAGKAAGEACFKGRWNIAGHHTFDGDDRALVGLEDDVEHLVDVAARGCGVAGIDLGGEAVVEVA